MDGVNTANALYRGWCDVEESRGHEYDATCVPAAVSSSFTAINHSMPGLVTPQSSVASSVQQNQPLHQTVNIARRRHDPAVAQYLGLEHRDEPVHLESCASLSAIHSPPMALRKRRRRAAGNSCAQANTTRATSLTQQLVSRSFRVAKPLRESVSNYLHHLPPTPFSRAASSQSFSLHETPQKSQDQSQYSDETVHGTTDYRQSDFSDAFELSEDALNALFDGDNLDGGIFDDDLLNLVPDASSMSSNHSICDLGSIVRARTSRSKEAEYAVARHTSTLPEIAKAPDMSTHSSTKFKSPLTQTSQLLAVTGDIENPNARKPIVRPPFPAAVRDRSPIIGLSSNTSLRTCFRIGEVVHQSNQASKSGKDVIFELYARVLESERSDTQQSFIFCDLFHARPPYIKGSYHANIWKSVQLFEYDSERLLQKGRICRSIGTMKRVGKEWIMTVLNIWEATWEDIKWTEGILNF